MPGNNYDPTPIFASCHEFWLPYYFFQIEYDNEISKNSNTDKKTQLKYFAVTHACDIYHSRAIYVTPTSDICDEYSDIYG